MSHLLSTSGLAGTSTYITVSDLLLRYGETHFARVEIVMSKRASSVVLYTTETRLVVADSKGNRKYWGDLTLALAFIKRHFGHVETIYLIHSKSEANK